MQLKGQIFYGDVMIAVIIFGVAVVLFVTLSNTIRPGESVFDVLVADSESITSALLTAGEPYDWTYDNVTNLGVTEETYRLNATKAERLMNISPDDGADLFGVNSNYAVFFKDKLGNTLFFGGCVLSNGNLTVQNLTETICENFTVIPDENLVHAERLVMYNSEIIKIVSQTWI